MARRFFSDASFWNQPIAPGPAVDPRSDALIAMLAAEHDEPALHINMQRYTIGVYAVDADTPRHVVHQWYADTSRDDRSTELGRLRAERRSRHRQHPDFVAAMPIPIPDHAMVDAGTDKHLAVVDYDRGVAWDMWHADRDEQGRWRSYTGMTYDLHGPGVWRTEDFGIRDGESIHHYGPGRAAGVPIIAGLIMHHEILAGRIEHKIAFACWNNAHAQFQFPAAWTDGFCDDGLPEGAVLQLDPALDLDRFPLSPAGRTIARALQEYGMVDVDNARGNVVYAEGLFGEPDKRWDGLLTSDALRCIPIDRYRVLKLGPITPMGDAKWSHRDPPAMPAGRGDADRS